MNRFNRQAWQRVLAVGLLLLLAGGCAGSGKTPGKITKPPKLPPKAPPARAEALRQDLRDEARREILAAANYNDPVIRAHALEALHDTSSPAFATPEIVRGLRDEMPLVRFAAAMAAGEARIKDAYDPLQVLSADHDTNCRIAARFALHRLGDTRLSHDFEKYAQDLDPGVRGNTAMALGLLGEQSALKILRAMRRDPNPGVRLQVAEAMWRLGDDDALQTLVGESLSRYPDEQMVSILALAAPRDTRVIEHVRGLLVTDYQEVNLVAARAMGELGSDEGYGVALRGVRSNDPRQRLLAALAFGAIGRADAQEVLEPLLKDPDADVRLSASTAILQLKGLPAPIQQG